MTRSYDHRDISVLPDDLWDLAWSAPMRDLATRIGMSDVGLKKMLKAHGVPTPPQGHWNRVQAGRDVSSRPPVPARRPGEDGRVRLDRRFRAMLTPAEPMASDGPFASELVPEDLEELRARELKAIGRVAVPRSLTAAHPALREVLARDERRRVKFAADPYPYNAPEFDGPLAKRRLRILNTLFLTLARRGHGGRAYDRDGELSAAAVIGHTTVGLEIVPVGRQRTVVRHGYVRPAPDLPAATPLRLTTDPGYHQKDQESWEDDAGGRLEDRIAVIAAAIIVAGERRLRSHLREERERIDEQRRLADEARSERAAALARKRLEDLRASGELLRQADDLRRLVARVKIAVTDRGHEADVDAIRAWEEWALGEADRLDPIVSGQIRTHLLPPASE